MKQSLMLFSVLLIFADQSRSQFSSKDNRIVFSDIYTDWQENPPISFKKRQTSKNSIHESNDDAMSRTSTAGSEIGVTHSEMAGRSSPTCKSKGGSGDANLGQGSLSFGGRDGFKDEKLAVNDRVLKNYLMTQSLMYGNCGKPQPAGTICFGTPSGCVEEKACRLIVNFRYDESNPAYILVNFAGEASHSGYIAFAFSQDRFIDSDLMVYCINAEELRKNSTDSGVALYLARTDKHRPVVIQKSSKNYERNFCPRFGSHQKEMLGCSFDLASNAFLDDGSQMDIKNRPFYLMLALGNFIDSLPINDVNYGVTENQHLVEFSSNPVVLRDVLLQPKIIYPRSRALVLLHAITAVFSFVFLIPSGIFIAKYGREVNGNDLDVCARYRMPAWLRNHIFMAVISFPFILTSLIAILVELDFSWRSSNTKPFLHSIAGIFAYFLVLLNVVGGCFFKVQPFSEYAKNIDANVKQENVKDSNEKAKLSSRIITWAHWLFGNMTYLCAVLCVCVAASLPRAQAPCMVEYFGYLHVSLFFLSHLLMTIDTKRLAKVFGDDRPIVHLRAIIGPMTTWRMKDISKLNSGHKIHEMDVWKVRKRVIIFFFLVSFIIAFTICVLMTFPVVLCR